MLSAKGLEEKHTEHGDCKELGKTFYELLVQVELGTVTAGVKAVFGAVLPFPGGRVEMKETSSKKQMGVSIKGWVPSSGLLSHLRGMLFFHTAGLMARRRQVPALNKKSSSSRLSFDLQQKNIPLHGQLSTSLWRTKQQNDVNTSSEHLDKHLHLMIHQGCE